MAKGTGLIAFNVFGDKVQRPTPHICMYAIYAIYYSRQTASQPNHALAGSSFPRRRAYNRGSDVCQAHTYTYGMCTQRDNTNTRARVDAEQYIIAVMLQQRVCNAVIEYRIVCTFYRPSTYTCISEH